MSKFACIQYYNDYGNITAYIEAVEDYALEFYERTEKNDKYVDIFDSWKEAEQCMTDAINA